MKIYQISEVKDNGEMDHLMLAGWGVANQLPIDNYARKGWDVAFRIAKSATIEQRDIAMRVLKDAAKVLLKELWKTKTILNPKVKEYYDKLNGIL